MSSVISLICIFVGLYSLIRGYTFSKTGSFYKNTHFLNLIGIYVWGDALILGPFWLLSGVLFWFLPIIWIARYLLVFFFFRSFIEIIYWINHQVAQRSYQPPIFYKISWLGANEAAILYQLIHTVMVVVALVLLLASFAE